MGLFKKLSLYARQRFFSPRIRRSGREKIVFVVPPVADISGGILSIMNMSNMAKEFFPDRDVYVCEFTPVQKRDRYPGSDMKTRVLNLKYFLPAWLRRNDKILFHVYEGGVVTFLKHLEKLGLLDKMKNSTLNILNQNQDYMPSGEDFSDYLHFFKKVTMTLAFKNNEKIDFPYLSMPAMHVGAFFEGPESKAVPFREKQDLCVVSVDEHPMKTEIVKKIKDLGIEIYDRYPIPFREFVELQKKAKWTVSFGEGWDGYTMGQLQNGGIGFGVYQPNFVQKYFNDDDLPKFLFRSYKEMSDNIAETIAYYNNEKVFEEENKKWLEIVNADEDSNSLSKVKERWKNYYKKTGYLA